jgi:hypothetical protein
MGNIYTCIPSPPRRRRPRRRPHLQSPRTPAEWWRLGGGCPLARCSAGSQAPNCAAATSSAHEGVKGGSTHTASTFQLASAEHRRTRTHTHKHTHMPGPGSQAGMQRAPCTHAPPPARCTVGPPPCRRAPAQSRRWTSCRCRKACRPRKTMLRPPPPVPRPVVCACSKDAHERTHITQHDKTLPTNAHRARRCRAATRASNARLLDVVGPRVLRWKDLAGWEGGRDDIRFGAACSTARLTISARREKRTQTHTDGAGTARCFTLLRAVRRCRTASKLSHTET